MLIAVGIGGLAELLLLGMSWPLLNGTYMWPDEMKEADDDRLLFLATTIMAALGSWRGESGVKTGPTNAMRV